jgi:hypothetical protein
MRELTNDEMELVTGGKKSGGGSGGGTTKTAGGKVNKDGTKAKETVVNKTPAPRTWGDTWKDYRPSSGCFSPSIFGNSLGEICWGK